MEAAALVAASLALLPREPDEPEEPEGPAPLYEVHDPLGMPIKLDQGPLQEVFSPFIIFGDAVGLIKQTRQEGCKNPSQKIYHAFTLFIMLYNSGFMHYKLLYELARCYYGAHKTISDSYIDKGLAINLMKLSVKNPAGNDVDFWEHRSHLVEYLVNDPRESQRTYDRALKIIQSARDYRDLTPESWKRYREKLNNVILDLNLFIVHLWHPATEYPFTMSMEQKIEITESVHQYFPEVPNAVAQIKYGFKPFTGPCMPD